LPGGGFEPPPHAPISRTPTRNPFIPRELTFTLKPPSHKVSNSGVSLVGAAQQGAVGPVPFRLPTPLSLRAGKQGVRSRERKRVPEQLKGAPRVGDEAGYLASADRHVGHAVGREWHRVDVSAVREGR
jgi:hypothetical protein